MFSLNFGLRLKFALLLSNQAVYCTECFDKIVTLTITETLSWEPGAGVKEFYL